MRTQYVLLTTFLLVGMSIGTSGQAVTASYRGASVTKATEQEAKDRATLLSILTCIGDGGEPAGTTCECVSPTNPMTGETVHSCTCYTGCIFP